MENLDLLIDSLVDGLVGEVKTRLTKKLTGQSETSTERNNGHKTLPTEIVVRKRKKIKVEKKVKKKKKKDWIKRVDIKKRNKKTKKVKIINTKFIRVYNPVNTLLSIRGLIQNKSGKLKKLANYCLGKGDIGWVLYDLWIDNKGLMKLEKVKEATKLKSDKLQRPFQEYNREIYMKPISTYKEGARVSDSIGIHPLVMDSDVREVTNRSKQKGD